MTDETLQQSSRRPFDLPWNYDRTELRADGVVHAIGLGLALVAVVFLLDLTFESTQGFKTASVLIYVAGLFAMLVARFSQIEGYRCLSLVRASLVVKCQSDFV
jgi:predicted membrane channel-forming protein YqfA (hemolysin III family)